MISSTYVSDLSACFKVWVDVDQLGKSIDLGLIHYRLSNVE